MRHDLLCSTSVNAITCPSVTWSPWHGNLLPRKNQKKAGKRLHETTLNGGEHMPLTEKGEKIKGKMEKTYGKEKGKEVFYASKNKGKITGVDTHADDNQHMGFTKGEAKDIEKLVSMCDALSSRLDAFEKRRAMQRPAKVEPRNKDNMQPSNRHPKEPVRVTGG